MAVRPMCGERGAAFYVKDAGRFICHGAGNALYLILSHGEGEERGALYLAQRERALCAVSTLEGWGAVSYEARAGRFITYGRSTVQQPGRKSASRPADKPRMNRLSAADRPRVNRGFCSCIRFT